MAERIPARLTPSHQGRRFGLTVGTAFLVLAALTWWRDHPTAMVVLGSLGGALVLAGLTVPAHLGPVERAWMGLAHAMSKVTTPVVMAVMYLGVITPVAVLRRLFGGNPMVHGSSTDGFWRSRPEGARRSASLHRQF